MVPGTWLRTLADKMKMTGFEWRILVFILAAGPVSAYQVHKQLGVHYQHAKKAIKELRHWNIIERGDDGLTFQPDPARWDRSEVLATRPRTPATPSNRPKAPQEAEEEVSVP